LRCERSTEARQLLLMDCFFLAANCMGNVNKVERVVLNALRIAALPPEF
jgi:hypothetical protein